MDCEQITAEIQRVEKYLYLLRLLRESFVEPKKTIAEVERIMIDAVMVATKGHRETAAKRLGIGVRTLSERLREYGYPPGWQPERPSAKVAAMLEEAAR